MIIEIDDKLVSQELFDKHFVCNLSACKGACCVEGDDGAPLTMEEVEFIEEHLEEIGERNWHESNGKAILFFLTIIAFFTIISIL